MSHSKNCDVSEEIENIIGNRVLDKIDYNYVK